MAENGWVLTRAPGAKGDGTPATVFTKEELPEGAIDLDAARELVAGLDGPAGLIEKVTLAYDPETGRAIDAVIDEEGKIKGLPASLMLMVGDEAFDFTAGPVAIVAATPEGEWTGLTDAEAERVVGMLTGTYTLDFTGGGMVPHLAPATWNEEVAA